MKKIFYSLMSILLVASFMLFAVASGGDAETSGDGESKKTDTEQKAEMATYKLGETITVKNSSGEYKICFTNVKETTQRNQFSDVEAKRVILISYDYENISCEDDLYISSMDMKVYDKDSNILETYPATEEKSPSAVGKGRKGNGVLAYALNNDNNYIEIEYYDNIFNSTSDCKVQVEW